MSLKVWLPLDGDLRNNGTLDVVITNNGATINNDGKIGQCYQFDNNSSYIDLNHSELYNILNGSTQPFSICFWVYHADTSRAIIFGDYAVTGYKDFNIELATGHTLRWYWGTPDIGISEMNVGLNTWTHVTFTYSGTVLKGYINGIEKYTYTITLNAKNRTTGSYYLGRDGRTGTTTLNGKLNDFRIYDHCLSAAEVHEIAQGLVVHYKLDNGSQEITTNIPSTNVYTYPTFNTASENGGWSHWGPSGHSGSYGQNTDKKYIYNKNNTYSHWISEDAGTNSYNLLYKSPEFEGGYRSLQAIIKEENGLPITDSICYPTWNARNGGVPNNKWTSIKSLGDGFYYCCAEGISQDGSNDLVGIDVRSGYKIYVSEFYLENDVEKCSPIFSYSSNIIQDSSGYGHNATLVNTIEVSYDTPRYTTSTALNGTTTATIEKFFPDNVLIPELTYACWVKRTYTTATDQRDLYRGILRTFLSSYNGIDFRPFITWMHATTSSSSTNSWTTGDTIPINTWVHMAWTFKDGLLKYYQNGAYVAQSDRTGTGQFIKTNYHTGLFGIGTSTAWQGNLSDMRIYTTALLGTDIKLLYNMGSRVDNLGRVHSFELEEKDNNLLAGALITSAYGNRTNPYTKYNSNGEMYFDTNGTSTGSSYISINPTNHTYYYDFDISVNAGNQFYIGFERYDADKTIRSNAATVYVYTTKATEDVNHKHIFGTVNLSTDGVNPCAFIALRILNGWSGTTSGVVGTATIHSMSLREISNIQNPKSYKNGILSTGEFKEYQKASFYKNGFIEATEFIEI